MENLIGSKGNQGCSFSGSCYFQLSRRETLKIIQNKDVEQKVNSVTESELVQLRVTAIN